MMNETQLLSSKRLDKLEDLVEEVRRIGGFVTDYDDDPWGAEMRLDTMTNLLELQDLCSSMLREIATKHKISQE
jgi:hypothetical protein